MTLLSMAQRLPLTPKLGSTKTGKHIRELPKPAPHVVHGVVPQRVPSDYRINETTYRSAATMLCSARPPLLSKVARSE